jgi:hypothetical protein
MKNIFLYAFLTLAASFALLSQPTIPLQVEVGKSPTFVHGYYDFFAHDFRLEFFTIGYDANFDKKEDPGDEKPGWYRLSYSSILSGNTNPEKIRDFPFASMNFPTRIAIDNVQGFVFVPDTNLKIAQYKLSDGTFIGNFSAIESDASNNEFSITGISQYDKFLFISVRYSGTSSAIYKDFVNVINLETKNIILTISAPLMVQQTLAAEDKLFVLGEGNFGTETSQIFVYDISNLKYGNAEMDSIATINIGNTGNHISFLPSNKLLVTVNGSHTIHIINTDDIQIEKTIQLPTTGYNGPRETQPFGANTILTTAYDGKLYLHNTDGSPLSPISLYNKLEGLFTYVSPNPNIKFDIVVATSPFKDDYSPNNVAYIMVNFTSVGEEDPSKVDLYPNPANSFVRINIENPINTPNKIEILDNLGNIIRAYSYNLLGSEILLPIDDVPSGTYFARITSDKSRYIVPFVITR